MLYFSTTALFLERALAIAGRRFRQLSLVLSGIAKAGAPACSSVTAQSFRKRDGTITLAADLADQRRQEALDGVGEKRIPYPPT
jgi:hypothetical protein